MKLEFEYSQKLLSEFLKCIACKIDSGDIDDWTCQKIWNSLFWDAKDPENKKMINYLIVGKMVMEKSNTEK